MSQATTNGCMQQTVDPKVQEHQFDTQMQVQQEIFKTQVHQQEQVAQYSHQEAMAREISKPMGGVSIVLIASLALIVIVHKISTARIQVAEWESKRPGDVTNNYYDKDEGVQS